MRFLPVLLCPVLLCALTISAPLAAEAPLKVGIVTAEQTTVAKDLRVVGAIEAKDSYPASFRRGGQVIALPVEVGQNLAKGDVIAEIDPTTVLAEQVAAQAVLDAAAATLLQAEQARERAQSMLDRGIGTQAQYDAAHQSYLSARAARDQAQAMFESAEQAVEDTTLIAERDVIVIERDVDVGEVVAAGAAVVTLAPEELRQAVFLAPDVAGLSSVNGEVITLEPAGDVPAFAARVSEILPVLNDTGTVEIRVEIGMSEAANIPLGTSITGHISFASDPVITLPWSALSSDAKGPAVWIFDPDTTRVTLRTVSIGGYDDDRVELLSGITPGEQVVTEGSHLLFEGRTVAPSEAEK